MIRGTLDRLHLGDVLQWLEMAAASGRLSVRQQGWERRIDLLEGRVVYVSSTHPAERPAAWLARSAPCSPRKIRSALARSMLGRGRLTDLLAEAGSISREILEDELQALAFHVAGRILVGGSGEFEFDPDYPVPGPPALTLDLTPQTLMLEAARRTDESPRGVEPPAGEALPFTGEAFEGLFWEIVERAFPVPAQLDGPTLSGLHRIVRDVTGTLAQWLKRSPGLVPVPAPQLDAVHEALSDGSAPGAAGSAHLAWNLLTLASAIPPDEEDGIATLDGLARFAGDHELWIDLASAERLRRPARPRIDGAVAGLTEALAAAASAAAEPLGADPGLASLAAHLLVVPTDLLLYVLATVPVPVEPVRRTLLEVLPRRLGHGLAARAGFPRELGPVLGPDPLTPLAAALHLAREAVPQGALLPPLAPDAAAILRVAGPAAAAEAARAAQEAVPG